MDNDKDKNEIMSTKLTLLYLSHNINKNDSAKKLVDDYIRIKNIIYNELSSYHTADPKNGVQNKGNSF